LIVLLIVLGVVIYFELRFMRSRNKDHIYRTIEKDDVYNAITTTRAIASSLRQRGRDTKEAEGILSLAEGAYRRNDLSLAKGHAMKARDILINAPVVEIAPSTKEVKGERPAEERKTVQAVKKLEPNMLESRFIISSCRGMLEKCSSEKDVTEAEDQLCKAEMCFEEKRYDEALREGMRARRMLGDGLSDVPPARAEVAEKAAEERKCDSCSAVVGPDDAFCRKCGAPIAVRRTCARCSAEMEEGDAFCPKCGNKA